MILLVLFLSYKHIFFAQPVILFASFQSETLRITMRLVFYFFFLNNDDDDDNDDVDDDDDDDDDGWRRVLSPLCHPCCHLHNWFDR